VLQVTAQNACHAGFRSRFCLGSAFTAELGTGYDAIVTNLFHHFEAADNTSL
jgi:hypothetical protein